jgi:hypothetical protein
MHSFSDSEGLEYVQVLLPHERSAEGISSNGPGIRYTQ